jgi:hypothetical protein
MSRLKRKHPKAPTGAKTRLKVDRFIAALKSAAPPKGGRAMALSVIGSGVEFHQDLRNQQE